MEKGSKYGRKQHEEVWQNTEVDALFKLAAAGVRVPQPYVCLDGVLLMELITDEDGNVAPRLNDVALTPEQAVIDHHKVIRYVVRMLCAGLIHGDLSEFNVLVDSQGPVIIDLPQVVDAAANNQAKAMLERDVNNMRNYYGMYAPELLKTRYAQEMWALFEDGKLTPESELTGHFEESRAAINLDSVLHEIRERRGGGLCPPGPDEGRAGRQLLTACHSRYKSAFGALFLFLHRLRPGASWYISSQRRSPGWKRRPSNTPPAAVMTLREARLSSPQLISTGAASTCCCTQRSSTVAAPSPRREGRVS